MVLYLHKYLFIGESSCMLLYQSTRAIIDRRIGIVGDRRYL